jgi:hypothetical protein
MIRDAWTTTIALRPGEEVIVVKVKKNSASNRGLGQRVVNALRRKIPVDKLALDVVVMDGEPIEQPLLTGTNPEAEQFVRNLIGTLATRRWQLMKLDW